MSNQTSITAADVQTPGIVIKDKDAVDRPAMALSDRYTLHDLEHLQERPYRIEASVKMLTAESFVAYVKRFATDAAIVAADADRSTFIAHLDYHEAPGLPTRSTHAASYACPLSREWQAWKEADGSWMGQEQFALFLEDRCGDVTKPTGGELLQMALNFKSIKKATFGAAKNLANGEFSLQYSEENQKGTVELPSELTVTIPVYRGDAAYAMQARLRHRVADGQLKMRVDLVNPEVIAEDAFNHMRKAFAEQLPEVLLLDGRL
jgi:uncharacterized protein YfdQ (DUF2303 family)